MSGTVKYTDAQRLGWAEAYAQMISDPAERVHVDAMITHWQRTGAVCPVSLRFQTLPMRQVARILRGGARYDPDVNGVVTLP